MRASSIKDSLPVGVATGGAVLLITPEDAVARITVKDTGKLKLISKDPTTAKQQPGMVLRLLGSGSGVFYKNYGKSIY